MQAFLQKYFKRAKVKYLLQSNPDRLFRNAIIIPAYAEFDFLPQTLDSLLKAGLGSDNETMLNIVINNPPEPDKDKLANNRKTLEMLKRKEFPYVFWMDASSPGREIPAKGGVGTARKIGTDSVLEYLDWNSNPLIFCLDADTLVDVNYISAARKYFQDSPKIPAAVFRFQHRESSDQRENEAIVDYELFMRFYVEALKKAKSPYAYHALGSAIVCRALSYVKAGGMRERNGGEDFYFLQALRKLGKIGEIRQSNVYPSSRPSDRVPFGTGPKIREIMSGRQMRVYNPEIFNLLKEIYDFTDSAKAEDFEKMPVFSSETMDFFNENNFAESWKKILKNTPPKKEHLKAAFNTWLDAFTTLKFVHFCEERFPGKFPKLPPLNAFKELSPEFDFNNKFKLLEFLRKN